MLQDRWAFFREMTECPAAGPMFFVRPMRELLEEITRRDDEDKYDWRRADALRARWRLFQKVSEEVGDTTPLRAHLVGELIAELAREHLR